MKRLRKKKKISERVHPPIVDQSDRPEPINHRYRKVSLANALYQFVRQLQCSWKLGYLKQFGACALEFYESMGPPNQSSGLYCGVTSGRLGRYIHLLEMKGKSGSFIDFAFDIQPEVISLKDAVHN